MSQSVDSLQALLRSNEEKLKVKEKQFDDLQKKFNVAKLKLQSLQKQVAAKNDKECKDSEAGNEPSPSINRGKLLLLQKQLAESKALLESKERENKEMKACLDDLAERAKVVEENSDYLKSSKTDSSTSSNLTRSSESDYEVIEERKIPELTDGEKDIQNLFAQIVLKDTRILELNQRCLDLEKRIIDLQENLKEKEEVLQARNKAVKMLMTQSPHTGTVPSVSAEDLATIEEQTKEINALQQKLAETELEKGNLQLRVMELEGNNGTRPPLIDIELERDDLKQQVDELKQKYNDILGRFETLEIENERLILAKNNLGSEINELKSNSRQLENKNAKLTSQIEQKDKTVSECSKREQQLIKSMHLLQKDMEEKEEEVNLLKSQMSELAIKTRTTIVEKDSIITSLRLELDNKEENLLLEKDEIINDLNNQLQGFSADKDSLVSQLEEERNSCIELKRIVEENEKAISELQKECVDLKEKLSASSESISNYETQLLLKNNELKLLSNSSPDIDKIISEQKETVQMYEKQLSELKANNESLLASRKKLEQRLEDVLKQRDESNTKAADLEEDKQELIERLDELETQSREAVLQLKKVETERKSFEFSLQDLRNEKDLEIHEKNRKIEALQEQLKSQLRDMSEIEDIIAEKESIIADLSQKLDSKSLENVGVDVSHITNAQSLEQELKKCTDSIQSLEKSVAEKDALINTLSHEKSNLIEKINELREELEAFDAREEDSNHEHKKQMQELKDSRKCLQLELDRLSEELANMKTALESELKSKEDVIELKLKLQQLLEENKNLNDTIENITEAKEKELSALRLKLADLTQNLDSCDGENKKQLKQYSDQINELKSYNESLLKDKNALNEEFERVKKENEEEMNSLRLKLADFTQNWTSKTTTEDGHKQKIEEMSYRIDDLQSQNYLLTQDKQAFNEDLETMKKGYEEKLRILQLKLSDFSRDWDEFDKSHKKEVSSLTARIDELTSINSMLEDEKKMLFEEKEAVKKEKEHELNTLQLKLADFQQDWQKVEGSCQEKVLQLTRNIDELRSMNARLEDEKQTLILKIEKVKEEKENELSSLRVKLADLSCHSETLENDLRNKVGSLNERINELEHDNSVLQQNLFEVNENYVKLEEEKGAILQELNKKDDYVRTQIVEANEVFQRSRVALEEAQLLQQQNDNEKENVAKISALEEKLSNCQLEMFNVLSDKDDEILSLKHQIENLVKQLEMERIEMKKVALLYEESKKSIADLSTNNITALECEAKICELENSKATLQSEFQEKDKVIENLKNEIKTFQKKFETKCKEMENCTQNYELRVKELKERLESERSISDSTIAEQSNQKIAELEKCLNDSQKDTMQIIADNQSTIHSLRNEIAALINQLEFERSQTRDTVSIYEQQLQAIAAQQHNYVELESKCKRLSAKLKVKDREVTVLQSKMTLFKEEFLREKEDELESCHKKIAELESIAKSQEEKLTEECSKRRAYEEEIEKFWRISKMSSSTNLMMEDIESDGSSNRSTNRYLSAIQRLSRRVTRNWLQTGPPSRRFKRYVFILYLLIIHILVIKSFFF